MSAVYAAARPRSTCTPKRGQPQRIRICTRRIRVCTQRIPTRTRLTTKDLAACIHVEITRTVITRSERTFNLRTTIFCLHDSLPSEHSFICINMTTFTISDKDIDQIKDQIVVITGVPVLITTISHTLTSPRRLLRHRPRNPPPHPRPRRQSLCLGREPPPLT